MTEHVLITGAASGIGRALVLEYITRKYTVSALDIDATGLSALSSQVTDSKKLSTYTVDVTDVNAFEKVTAQCVKDNGAPYIWINNAGIATVSPFEKISAAEFEKIIRVNLMGVVNGTRCALSVMKNPERGSIANMSSVNGVVSAPFMSAYAASKHAVVGFTRALQLEKEQAQSPIKISLILPGFVKTPIMAGREGFQFPHWLEWMIDKPERVAREIVKGIARGDDEISPTVNGHLLLKLHRLVPRLTPRTSRLLVAKDWKQLFGLEPIKK